VRTWLHGITLNFIEFSNIPINGHRDQHGWPSGAPDACGLQLIQRSGQRLGRASGTLTTSTFTAIVVVICVHLRLTAHGVR
jgi:hypothetical protein